MNLVAEHVALFGAGVASFLAPCVVPLVPAYVGMMAGEMSPGGSTTRQVDAPDAGPSNGRIVAAGVLFVAGFTAVFVTLGVLAGAVGSALEPVQQWVQRVGGGLVIAFGLVLLVGTGWVGLRDRRLVRALPARGRVARPVVMGVAFGAAWTPCVGPLLGAALVVAARGGDPWRGASLLAAYAIGIGLPFVVIALTVASWPALASGLRRFSARVERPAGALLVLVGVLLVTGTYVRVLSPIARLVPGST